jgi:hypothetical protein
MGDEGDERAPLDLATAGLRPGFARRVVVIAPHGALVYDRAAWDDALVVVAEGSLELERATGVRECFARGAVLTLAGLSLRALHNPGAQRTVLIAVARAPGHPG